VFINNYKKILLLILIPLSLKAYSAVFTDETFDTQREVWDQQKNDAKGGKAYEILSSEKTFDIIMEEKLTEWGDLNNLEGVEKGFTLILSSSNEKELPNTSFYLHRQERLENLRSCLSYEITDKFLYPEKKDFEKQKEYISKKYKPSLDDSGKYTLPKSLKKALDKCQPIFLANIKKINIYIQENIPSYQKERDRILLEKKKKEHERKLLEEQKKEETNPITEKNEDQHTSKKNTQPDWPNGIPWGIMLAFWITVLGILSSLIEMFSNPEVDNRTKTGYKNNEEPNGIRYRIVNFVIALCFGLAFIIFLVFAV